MIARVDRVERIVDGSLKMAGITDGMWEGEGQ